MAAQQLFEKVELRFEGELAKIQGLLDIALERRLQEATPDELTEEDRQELAAASAEFIAQLRQLVVFASEDDTTTQAGDAAGSAPTATTRTQLTPAAAVGSLSLALRSPLLPPLSPPPADAEVAALEAEVTAASLRVAELRTSMQVRLQEQLAARLAACRPTAELDEPAAAAVGAPGPADLPAAAGAEEQQKEGAVQPQAQASQAACGAAHVPPGEAGSPPADQQAEAMEIDMAVPAAAGGDQQQPPKPEAAELPLSPQPAELQQRLLAATSRMPTLRARLEAATDRLQRVVSAVAADMNRPPPNTVEKAMLGKTPGRGGGGAGGGGAAGGQENELRVSPLVLKAVESGQISTRRRMVRDVQPLPFPESQ